MLPYKHLGPSGLVPTLLKVMNLRGLRAITLLCVLFSKGASTAVFGAAAATNSILHLHFQTNSAGETILRHGQDIAAAAKATNILNVSQLSTNRGAQYSLIPADSLVAITSEEYRGWSVEIPPRQSATFSFEYARRVADLQTSDLNRRPIHLTFSDGAYANMDGQADGRLELMDDDSYAFFAAGPVTAQTADGSPVRFGSVFPPLFGGKLITPPTNQPNARFARATPVVPLVFEGQIDHGLSARVGPQSYPLESGHAQNVKAPNGAEISLLLNASTHTLDWEVRRGIFRINVESFRCWKALATSGQAASMQWDTNGVMMEIRNKISEAKDAFRNALLVNLNPALNVSVGPNATFQYGRTTDCSTFVASAYGGETTLYNAQLDSFIRLDHGNANFISGNPAATADASTIVRTPVRLGWSTPEKVEVKSGKESITVLANGHEVFKPDAATELDLTLAGSDRFTLRVDAGQVAVTPDFMPTITIEISEGSSVSFAYQRAADILQVESDARNLSPISLRTPTGFYPQIHPGTRLTFVINRSTFTSDQDGALIFSETAGAGTSTFLTSPNPLRSLPTGRGVAPLLIGTPTHRVEQPPATTLD
jgi:hypothetical protein